MNAGATRMDRSAFGSFEAPMDYNLGLDLGQAADYTALAILERREQAEGLAHETRKLALA